MQMLKRTVSVDKFLPHVMAATLGDETIRLPESAARSFIINSAVSFAERSGYFKQKIKINLQCGLSHYPLDAYTDETIIGVNSADMGQFSHCPEERFTQWNWGNVNFRVCDDVLEIYPAPTKDIMDGLSLELVVSPKRDCCELDAAFYDKWFDAVVNGALSEIHMMPNFPWSSVSRADQRKRMFNEDVGRATVRSVMEGTREPMKIKPNLDFVKIRNAQRRW